jgi:hypothetical protein
VKGILRRSTDPAIQRNADRVTDCSARSAADLEHIPVGLIQHFAIEQMAEMPFAEYSNMVKTNRVIRCPKTPRTL